jgi:predicted ferric reductase
MLIPKVLKNKIGRQELLSSGYFIMLLLLAITWVLWLLSKYKLSVITSYPLLSIGQLCGLSGITLICINFILATRFKFLENLFYGIDRVYKAHEFSGKNAFLLLLLHPILLTLQFLPNLSAVFEFLNPLYSLEVAYGKIALTILTVLIYLTVFAKIPYHIWKSTHKFMGVVLLFGSLHAMTIPSDINAYDPLHYYILTLLILAIFSYLYKQLLYRYLAPKIKAVVNDVIIKDSVTEIYLKPLRKTLKFNPGQFIFVSFRNSRSISKESHPFTISSGQNEEIIRISPKKSGDGTNTFPKLEKGVETLVQGPYGMFGDEALRNKKDELWIAGGIGITPFLSMMHSDSITSRPQKVELIYSYSEPDEGVYIDEINKALSRNTNFKIHNYCSNLSGRLDVEKISQMIKLDIKSIKIFLCGPSAMMNALADQFIKAGVKPRNIFFEEFSLW